MSVDDRKFCPLWRVTINGERFEMRAKTLEGALMSAVRRDTQERMARDGIRVNAHMMNAESRADYDWHETVITVERIGDPLESRPIHVIAQPITTT